MLNSRQLLLFIMAIKIGGKLQTYNFAFAVILYEGYGYKMIILKKKRCK